MASRDPIASASSRQGIMDSRHNNNVSPDGSRAALIGRKRRAPQNNFTGGDKRAKLDSDIISISDDDDDHHRQASIESGEVATSASGSSQGEQIMTLDDIESDNLRHQIRQYIEREDVSLHEAVARHAARGSGMPWAKEARLQARKWGRPDILRKYNNSKTPISTAPHQAGLHKEVVNEDDVIGLSHDDDGVSVGQSPSDDGDYGALARHAATENPPPDRTIPTAAVLLADLSKEDQDLQTRYFGLTNPTDPIRCISCGKQNHMQPDCPSNICKHCTGAHFAHTCPTNRKCRRCRHRGHDAGTCSNRPVYGGGSTDRCDYCDDLGHVEEECPSLFRTFHPDRDPELVKRVFHADMRVACYNCASSQHWGDDCPRLPGFAREMPKSGVWSGERASRFIRDVLQGGDLRGEWSGSEDFVPEHPNAYQLALLDD